MLRSIVILLSIGSLLSCGSTADTALNCAEPSWFAQGKTSALNGKAVRYFDKYVQQCGKQLPDNAKQEFIQGFSAGLAEYCTYETGYKRGVNNLPVNNNCPLETRADFELGYKNGDFVYRDNQRNIDRVAKKSEQENMQQSRERPVEKNQH